jgi:hypothetical protein
VASSDRVRAPVRDADGYTIAITVAFAMTIERGS